MQSKLHKNDIAFKLRTCNGSIMKVDLFVEGKLKGNVDLDLLGMLASYLG